MTDNIPNFHEAVAAIKLTRADAVKMVADQLALEAAGDVATCERGVTYAADMFRAWAVKEARNVHAPTLAVLAQVVGKAANDLHANVTYRVYDNGEDSGTQVQVVFSDHQQSYEANVRVATQVTLQPAGQKLRIAWTLALLDLKNAKERDVRVGAMKKVAREKLIKSALDSADAEGVAVVAAIKALAKALKNKA